MATRAMKRWPYLMSFVLFIALCVSVAYWAMQLFKPPARPVAAPPAAQASAPKIDAAASLFGGRGTTTSAGNYELKGLVLASTLEDSVVILSSNNEPARAYRASKEIAPGVSVKEVHPGYIMLSENGALRRVELPTELAKTSGRAEPPPVRTSTAPPSRTMPSAAETASGPVAGRTPTAAGQPSSGPVYPADQSPSSGPSATARAQPPVVVTSPPTMNDPAASAQAVPNAQQMQQAQQAQQQAQQAAQQALQAQQAQQQPTQQQVPTQPQQSAAGTTQTGAGAAPQPGMTPVQPGAAGASSPVPPGVPQPVPTR